MPDAPHGLIDLAARPLTPAHEAELEALGRRSRGAAMWRSRKAAEVRELLALAEAALRLQVRMIDTTTDLRAVLLMDCPVPCMAASGGALRVLDRVLLGLNYPEEALRTPLPGHGLIRILEPRDVFHANVSSLPQPDPVQLVCLGTHLPVGLPVREVILATYGALTLQTVMIDEQDPAGVMNAEAALWWQQRPDLIPLTEEPFLPVTTPVPGMPGGEG